MNMKPNTYKIIIKTFNGKILTYTVDDYSVLEGDFVCFTDKVTKEVMRFHSSNCQIREVHE